ncbi:acyl-CoA dehydrogenase family protein [Novipirellula aureliae]|nr:acyl-CoA dehydrogenase family protein [Novipirellula aureliae]
MDELCGQLSAAAQRWKNVGDWPAESLAACANAGVIRWFMPSQWGGLGWNEVDQTNGYLRLSEVDLTTTFIITQLMGAVRRIAGSENQQPADRWLKKLISGEAFATVGVSHLTTSRQHLVKPVLRAEKTKDGFCLDGMAPWVTGAPHADVYVVGATMDDGQQILAAIPRSATGVNPHSGAELMALTASCTDRLEFDRVMIDESMLLAGPVENVMKSGTGGSTGGLQTSTLAVGLTRAAVDYLVREAEQRKDLKAAATELQSSLRSLEAELLRAVGGDANCDVADIRGRANRLVLNSTQAALMAAKGAGYLSGHPVNRWCREALFFLVWSCPRPIADAHLCELAGIA